MSCSTSSGAAINGCHQLKLQSIYRLLIAAAEYTLHMYKIGSQQGMQLCSASWRYRNNNGQPAATSDA
jgi:hypothetical protein